MMTEWVKYTCSTEQIKEIDNCKNGFVVRWEYNGEESEVITELTCDDVFQFQTFTHYLICNPHPLVDMIIRQAQTGQPVWIKVKGSNGYLKLNYVEYQWTGTHSIFTTTTPDWNIPNAEYSFKEFE